MESVISREATFLFNNLLLVALAFAILWGVVFPSSRRRSRASAATRSPYYNFFLVAFGLPLQAADRHRPADRVAAGQSREPRRSFRWP